jgi:hypothetical protein
MALFAVISFTESNKQIIIDCIKNVLKSEYAVYKDVVLFSAPETQNVITKMFDDALIKKIDFMVISINHISGRVDDNITEFVKKQKKVQVIPDENKN